MASDSGGKKRAEFSSMKSPPLTKQLKRILSEYPDGGQIIKELLQNADDAVATRLELLCDERILQYDTPKGNVDNFNRFFEGPALCVYNDAVFTSKDWEGIKMLDSSVKEDDRMKVGRFGQGFKSVFHLTDFPCVLSGDTLLLIDPQQPNVNEVNAMFDLEALDEYYGIRMDAFYNAFEGMFGLTRDDVKKGTFPGTIFRFPLRRNPSELSSNIYDADRLHELFEIFDSEASSILLFLRNLDRVTLKVRNNDATIKSLTEVNVANVEDIKEQRNAFNQTIKDLPKDYEGCPCDCCLILAIEYTSPSRGIHRQTCIWVVANYFMGGNATNSFKHLINDPELNLSPYVGVAAPIELNKGLLSENSFDGHVYCFLPLPKEGAKLTGLPVHMNGHFALNQSRHHLKLATDEQHGSKFEDKTIRWNQMMIQEALPQAYKMWFQHAIKYANNNGNSDGVVAQIHRAIPDVSRVCQNWTSLLKPLISDLQKEKILFTLAKRWVCVNDAYLIKEDAMDSAAYKDTIFNIVKLLDIDCVVVNQSCYDALTNGDDLRASRFTPDVLAGKLRQSDLLATRSDTEKMFILEYLLSGDEPAVLENLPLLPLESKEWVKFKSDKEVNKKMTNVEMTRSSNQPDGMIYMTTTEQVSMFPGMESRFLRCSQDKPHDVLHKLAELCENDEFQIRKLKPENLEPLLKNLIETTFTGSARKRLTKHGLTLDWLKCVWKYLADHGKESICQRVPLFPLLEKGSGLDDPDIPLICLSKRDILTCDDLTEATIRCLKSLGINVITDIPPWIPSKIVQVYVLQEPSPKSVSNAIVLSIGAEHYEEAIKAFNACDEDDRLAFMNYMSCLRECTARVRELLRKLQMFPGRSSYNGKMNLASVNQQGQFTSCENFPVRYPLSCLDGYEKGRVELLEQLGCQEIHLDDMFKRTFEEMKTASYYDDDVRLVMNHFVTNFKHLQYEAEETFPDLIQLAKEIPFLMTEGGMKKPSEVFNPVKHTLQALLLGQENVFPIFTDEPDAETIDILTDLGLKETQDVSAHDVLEVARSLDRWSNSTEKSVQDNRRKSRALIQHLSSFPELLERECEGRKLRNILQNLNIIEYETKRPENYPSFIPWFSHEDYLVKPVEAKSLSLQFLVGAAMPTLNSTSDELASAFGWTNAPDPALVIKQLRKVTGSYKADGANDILFMLCRLYEWFCNCEEDISELETEHVVWTGHGFSQPCEVIIKEEEGDVPLKPYFYFVPDTFREYAVFFEKIGCHSKQTPQLLMETLGRMTERLSSCPDKDDSSIMEDRAIQIVKKLAQRKQELSPESIANIRIPIRKDVTGQIMFESLSDCTYVENIIGYIGESEANRVYFADPVSALKLGMKTKRRRKVGKISKGIPFGQKEELVTRLKGLLNAYPRDDSVLKELLQNADDAGATELHFITDYRTHSPDPDLISDNFFGPALCVFNNSYFTEKDLDGIHKLGHGSKNVDPAQTGQYGVGFNAVYHLTDTPSFISMGQGLENGGVMCIFDPTCNNIVDVNKDEPGMRYSMNDFRAEFSKALLCFSEKEMLKSGVGTMFRFPLRKMCSDISDDIISTHDLDIVLKKFVDDLKEVLLFLKHVKSIKISDVTSGEIKTTYRVSCSMSNADSDSKKRFIHDVHCWKKQAMAPASSLPSLQSDVQYVETIEDSKGFKKTWLIIQKLGATAYPEPILNSLQTGKLCHLPVGGVAVPIIDFKEVSTKIKETEEKDAKVSQLIIGANKSTYQVGPKSAVTLYARFHPSSGHGVASKSAIQSNSSQEFTAASDTYQKKLEDKQKFFKGKTFAVLPLPVTTGLPVHINGHFALDHESRRDIWKEGMRLQWNEFLREHVIVPCYVAAISYFKQSFVEGTAQHVTLTSKRQLELLLSLYHNLFPVAAKEDFWSKLVSNFYEHVYTNETPIFPVTKVLESSFLVSQWAPLVSSTRMFSAVFNTISHLDKDENYRLEGVLKDLGMQLVQTPRQVFDTIAKTIQVNTKIFMSTPAFVMTFLRTFREKKAGACVIGQTETEISTTRYQKQTHLKAIVAYISKDDEFCSKVVGLPILLTADGILHMCSAENSVYTSAYADLVPKSASKFLHNDLRTSMCDKRLKEKKTGVLKSLNVHTLLDMLPDNVPELQTDEIIPWAKDSESTVSSKWVRRLFEFVYSESEKQSPLGTYVFNSDLFCENIAMFKGWAIFPSTFRATNDGMLFQLVPADKAYSVIQPEYDSEKEVNEISNQLNIPLLDNTVYIEKFDTRNLLHAVTNCITTTRNPYNVLKCLLFHKVLLIGQTISTDNALVVLDYFDRNLDAIKRKDGGLMNHIRALPLFVTIQHSLVCITNWSKVLVLENSLPIDGLQDWSMSTRILILQYSEKVERMYRYLGLQSTELIDVYLEIFSNDRKKMSLTQLLVHIEFVRDTLLNQQPDGTFTRTQERLIDLLKQIPFILINGEHKRADYFVDGEIPLFQCMVEKSKFLPKAFRSRVWTHSFLPLLGYTNKVTEAHILQFARAIEASGKNGLNDKLQDKSVLVLKRLRQLCKNYHNKKANRSDKISNEALLQLRSIRFIFPNKVDTKLVEIARQHDEGLKLIAFDGSVVPDGEVVCWSSMNVLPEKAVLVASQKRRDPVLAILRVHEEPPLECVIQHCKNISKPENVKCVHFDQVLDHVYEFLLNNRSDKHRIQARLRSVPMLFIPDDKIMVKCSAVAINLNQDDEIKPYLYKAPQRFGKFTELFETLGAYNQVTCNCVISVLEQLKQDVDVAEMTVRELSIATLAIRKLLLMINSENSREITGELYLPDKSRRLRKAKDLVVCDNDYIMERVQTANLSLDFFIGFQELKVEINNPAARKRIGLLPVSMQPRFLTDIIKEEVVTDNLTIVENCRFAMDIEEFVRSLNFQEGLFRIIHSTNEGIGETFEHEFSERLKNVKIRHADNIKTVCRFKGCNIPNSEQTKLCFIQDDVNTFNDEVTHTMYFQTGDRDHILDVILEKDGLIILIEKLINNYTIDIRQLTSILTKFEHPEQIKTVLDNEGISSYNLHRVYPKPGTLVEEFFHSFLEQDIRPFDKQEFTCVALELEDESGDVEADGDTDRIPVFIYVNIIQEVEIDAFDAATDESDTDLYFKYLVDNGTSQNIVVPIHRLYRFKRPINNHTLDIVKSNMKVQRSHNFDEHCRAIEKELRTAWTLSAADRKIVIRRLMLEWHPDKNKGDQEYCTSVFQFLMSLIEQLDASVDTPDGKPGYSEHFSYQRMSENVRKRASAYARDSHSNYGSYREFYFTGQTREPRPNVREARRWLEQANNDYLAAKKGLPEMGNVGGYNWICYMCHQACEKALKAGIYKTGANSYLLRTHCLRSAAYTLGNQELVEKAGQLQSRLGDHTTMRYPDSVGGTQIPSQVYNAEDAYFSLALVKEVLDIVTTMVS